MAAGKLSLKLLVDKDKNSVVLAESQRDFVDILFSFLTLPVGTVVRVLNKQSMLGCMDRLYESVEKLDPQFMQTKACKAMLLRPRSTAEEACEGLELDIVDAGRRKIYTCPTWECCTKTRLLFSHVKDAKCPCGLIMDRLATWDREGPNKDGVFVKGGGKFTISDGLHVVPISSTRGILPILHRFDIKNSTAFQEMTVQIGKEEMLNLLKVSLSSDTPLTDVFLRKVDMNRDADRLKQDQIPLTIKREQLNGTQNLKMSLVLSKSRNTLLYAEAGGDVVDLLLSFLTFPLGSIIKLLDKCSCMGCVDNLYKSIEELVQTDGSIRPDECATMLLSPKLAPHFACTSQLLSVHEGGPLTCYFKGCEDCFKNARENHKCRHGIPNVTLDALNPKLPNPGTESGGGFTRGEDVFLITDHLEVTPFSTIASVRIISTFDVPVSDLVVREVGLGEPEALNMLKASMISKNALSSVFCCRNSSH